MWPVLLYGCETWTTNKDDGEYGCIWDMVLLKINKKWLDWESNKWIGNWKCNGRKGSLKLIQRCRPSWLVHILKHKEIPWRVLEGKILGKRGTGRLEVTFIKQACRGTPMLTYLRLIRAIGDRYQWREIIGMLYNQHGGWNTWWWWLA